MSDIDLIKESNEKIPKNSILSLISDMVMPTLNNVSEFDKTRKYYKGDRVLKTIETTNHGICRTHHGIYECIIDGVVGEWNRTNWVEITLSVESNRKSTSHQIINIDLLPVVATEENQYFLSFSTSKINKENSYVVMFHPEKGLIDRNDYIIYSNSTTDNETDMALKLINWNLQPDDYVILLIFTFGETDDGYDVVYEFVEKVDTESTYVNFINYIEGIDKVLVFHNKRGILKESDYRIDTSKKRIYLKGFTMKAGESLSYIKFSKRGVQGFCNVFQKTLKVYENTNRLRIPLNSYNEGRDKFILFKKNGGYISSNYYTVSLNSNYVSFKYADRYPKINDEYIFIFFSSSDTNYIEDDSIDGSKLDEDIKLKLFPIRGNVTLTQEKLSDTVTLPKGRFIKDNYSVSTEVIKTTGDVGTIYITDKTETQFTINMTGIAKTVSIDYSVISK